MVLRRATELFSALTVLFLSVAPVSAGLSGGKPTTGITKFGTLPQAISTIFDFVIVIAAVIFVILFLVGGVQYLTAAGNEEATGKAKRLLVDAIVGLVIVLAAWAVGNFIIDRLIGTVPLEGGGGGGGGGGA